MKVHRQWGLALFLAGGATALVLGYVGYRELPGSGMTKSDALFSSIQLFVLGGSISGPGTPWALNVARFLAPLALAYATTLALAAIFWEQLQYLRVGLSARRHVLVLGFTSGFALPREAARGRRPRTVVVVPDRTSERIGVARSAGATVVVGDPTEWDVLRRLRAADARDIIVATGSDLKNLEVVAELKSLNERSRGRPVMHVEVEDEDLWAEMGRLALHGSVGSPVAEYFNRHDRAALALVNAAERLAIGTRRVHIEADGPLAMRVLVHTVRRGGLAGLVPQVCLGGSKDPDPVETVRQRHPWISETATLEVCSAEHTGSAEGGGVALVCVSTSDAAGIGRALKLASSGAFDAVVVAVANDEVRDLLDATIKDARVTTVSGDLTLDGDFMHDSAREVLARARHDDYLAQEMRKGSTAAENTSLVPWADLPDALKESNRAFADSVGRVVGSLGAQLAPLRALTADHRLFDDADMVERLAVAEHERWVTDLRRDGWCYDAGPKDPIQRTHPLLIPWDQLDETERQKDRDAVRAIPRMLARVGYGLELSSVPGGRLFSRRL